MPENTQGYLIGRKDKYKYNIVGRYFDEVEKNHLLKDLAFFQKQDRTAGGLRLFWPLKVILGSAGYGHIRPLTPEEKKALEKEK